MLISDASRTYFNTGMCRTTVDWISVYIGISLETSKRRFAVSAIHVDAVPQAVITSQLEAVVFADSIRDDHPNYRQPVREWNRSSWIY